jgi:hypothetical protein
LFARGVLGLELLRFCASTGCEAPGGWLRAFAGAGKIGDFSLPGGRGPLLPQGRHQRVRCRLLVMP